MKVYVRKNTVKHFFLERVPVALNVKHMEGSFSFIRTAGNFPEDFVNGQGEKEPLG